MKKYELDEKTFEWLSVKPESGVHRFAVQTIGGFKKYDCFVSLDDAFQFVLELTKDDAFILGDVEIFDMRSNIVFTFTNMKLAFRTCLSRKEV